MGLGIIGTRAYPSETEVVLSPGEPVTVLGYTLVCDELQQEAAGDRLSTWAAISVHRDGSYLTTLKPRVDRYSSFEQTVAVPALRAGLREDLYLVLFWSSPDGSASLKVIVNPLVNFLWLGGGVFLAGGAVALWPPRARAGRLPASQARRRATRTVVGVAAGLLVLLAAAVALWKPDPGAMVEPAGRPLSGQPAPDFTLLLLDGSTLALADLSGQVTVVNFWTTWCPPCAEELPDLQSVWTEYQAQDVVFVGIAVQEEETEVQRMVSQFGLTYPLGMDRREHVASAYGITGVPETFVIDPEGDVAYVHVGPVSAAELTGELDSLLGR